MSASAQLSLLLARELATDDTAGSSSKGSFVVDILELHNLVAKVQDEADTSSRQQTVGPSSAVITAEIATSLLHRWTLRITSLIQAKNLNAQALGFQLALITARQNTSIFQQHSKAWYNIAFTAVTRKHSIATRVLGHALRFLLICHQHAARSSEYAREVANPASIRKIADALLLLSSTATVHPATRLICLETLSNLIEINASPLRPIAAQLQALAIGALCDKDTVSLEGGLREAGAKLLALIYSTTGKAQASEAWRRTVEGLCGNTHAQLDILLSTFDQMHRPTVRIQPLEVPTFSLQTRGYVDPTLLFPAATKRLAQLIEGLLSILTMPTERTAMLPLGTLLQLGRRLLAPNSSASPREQQESQMRLLQLALLPQVHLHAARLLGQVIVLAGDHFGYASSRILAEIYQTAQSYTFDSPLRSVFFNLAALVSSNAALHPDEGARSLSMLTHSLLQDIASICNPLPRRKAQDNISNRVAEEGGPKAKKARLFDNNINTQRHEQLVQSNVLCLVQLVKALHRIFEGSAWLLQPDVLNSALRLLLAYAMSTETIMASAMPYDRSAVLSRAVALSKDFRPAILRCLLCALQTPGKQGGSFAERAVGVFRSGILSADIEEREICMAGIVTAEHLIRPTMPPLMRTAAVQVALDERSGGAITEYGFDEAPEISDNQHTSKTAELSAARAQNEQMYLEEVAPSTSSVPDGQVSPSLLAINRSSGNVDAINLSLAQDSGVPSAKVSAAAASNHARDTEGMLGMHRPLDLGAPSEAVPPLSSVSLATKLAMPAQSAARKSFDDVFGGDDEEDGDDDSESDSYIPPIYDSSDDDMTLGDTNVTAGVSTDAGPAVA